MMDSLHDIILVLALKVLGLAFGVMALVQLAGLLAGWWR